MLVGRYPGKHPINDQISLCWNVHLQTSAHFLWVGYDPTGRIALCFQKLIKCSAQWPNWRTAQQSAWDFPPAKLWPKRVKPLGVAHGFQMFPLWHFFRGDLAMEHLRIITSPELFTVQVGNLHRKLRDLTFRDHLFSCQLPTWGSSRFLHGSWRPPGEVTITWWSYMFDENQQLSRFLAMSHCQNMHTSVYEWIFEMMFTSLM